MADLLGTTLSVGNGMSQSGQSNTDLLLAAFRRTKQADIDSLNSKKSALESRQVFFNQLRTKLQTLQSRIDDLQQSGAAAKFSRYKAASSDASILSASASSDALTGAVSVKVIRLATNDTLAGEQKTLVAGYAFAGETKTIAMGGTSVDVSFAADDTNETALKRIATAFNNAPDTTVSVALIKDTTFTGRLTFTSKNTGASNQLDFADGDVLAGIGITQSALNPNTAARTVIAASNAGFSLTNFADLSAKATINGVEVTRDSNSPSDILPGLSFTFLKAQGASEQPVSVNVSSDADGVADNVVTPLLSAYNDALKFLGDNAAQVRGDSALRSLQSALRGLFGSEITTVDPGNPRFLADAGITATSAGALSVTKKDMLSDLLKKDPKKISDLFLSDDGFAAKLKKTIVGLADSGGTISNRVDSLKMQITGVGKRTQDIQKRIDAQAESLRKEYQKMQELYLAAQSQTSLLNGFV